MRVSTSKYHRSMRGQAPGKLRSIPRGILPRMGGLAELANLKSTPDLPFGLTSRHKADRRAANSVPFRTRP